MILMHAAILFFLRCLLCVTPNNVKMKDVVREKKRGDDTTRRRICNFRFLSGLSLGVIATALCNTFVADLSQSFLSSKNDANATIASTSRATSAVASREAMLLKFFRKYRYILPTPRYDYNPYPAVECGQGPAFDGFFQQSFKFRSRLNEDKIIYQTFFQGRNITGNNGTYIELGAFDGRQESNTAFFDRCLGWKGLLMEGNPDSYAKVIQNRPFAHKMSLAPSCSAEYERKNRTIPFYRFDFTNAGLVGMAKSYEGLRTVDVPCGPLSPVLEHVFLEEEPILFFSLDVEGAEQLVLDTIDFTKVTIYVLMIEVQNVFCKDDNCQVRRGVREKMKEEGYLRYEGLVRASDVYVHPQSPYQIPESVRKPSE